MALKIPPALTAFIFGLAMWMVDTYIHTAWSSFLIPAWGYRLAFGFAIAIGASAVFQFAWQRTTVDPHRPGNASSLVTNGLYRISRNPMYLALVIALVAFGLKLGNFLSLSLIPLFVLHMNRFQIIPEEKVLRDRFEKEYLEYQAGVRRWL